MAGTDRPSTLSRVRHAPHVFIAVWPRLRWHSSPNRPCASAITPRKHCRCEVAWRLVGTHGRSAPSRVRHAPHVFTAVWPRLREHSSPTRPCASAITPHKRCRCEVARMAGTDRPSAPSRVRHAPHVFIAVWTRLGWHSSPNRPCASAITPHKRCRCEVVAWMVGTDRRSTPPRVRHAPHVITVVWPRLRCHSSPTQPCASSITPRLGCCKNNMQPTAERCPLSTHSACRRACSIEQQGCERDPTVAWLAWRATGQSASLVRAPSDWMQPRGGTVRASRAVQERMPPEKVTHNTVLSFWHAVECR